MKNWILLNPGPVNVTEKVRRALLMPDICHREEEFSLLLQQVRSKIIRVLNLNSDYSDAVLTGSGTAALEAAIVGAHCSSPGRLLALSNGVYGDRIETVARCHKIPTQILRIRHNQRFETEQVSGILRRSPSIKTVAMAHHETSTGMLNPLSEIGRTVKRYGKLFCVDAISSLGADPIDWKRAQIDFCVGTAGKCFHAFPGLSFVIAKRSHLRRLSLKKSSSFYLNLANTWKLQEEGDTPFTPAIQLFNAFNAALDEFLEESLPERIARYRLRAEFLREGFAKLALKFLLPRHFYSNTLTSLFLPKGFTYARLHDLLKKEGFVIYAGQNQLRRKIFRIAHMGEMSMADLRRLLETLSKILCPR